MVAHWSRGALKPGNLREFAGNTYVRESNANCTWVKINTICLNFVLYMVSQKLVSPFNLNFVNV